jgi:hypothetical protein
VIATFYAINPNGTQKWIFTMSGRVDSSPAIGTDGTIYVGTYETLKGKLYAINPNGTMKWVFPTGDRIFSSATIGTDGTIYVGSWDGKLYAINPNGTQKWAFTTGFAVDSPTIGADGTIYVMSSDGKVYAIYSSSLGPANSPWPMFHHDVRHTGLSNYIALNLPIPTAAPPIETFPQPNKLFVDSGTFIKNNAPSFSPDSQQFLNDHRSALNRFIS